LFVAGSNRDCSERDYRIAEFCETALFEKTTKGSELFQAKADIYALRNKWLFGKIKGF